MCSSGCRKTILYGPHVGRKFLFSFGRPQHFDEATTCCSLGFEWKGFRKVGDPENKHPWSSIHFLDVIQGWVVLTCLFSSFGIRPFSGLVSWLRSPQASIRASNPGFNSTADLPHLILFMCADILDHIGLVILIYWDICTEAAPGQDDFSQGFRSRCSKQVGVATTPAKLRTPLYVMFLQQSMYGIFSYDV